MNTHCTFSVASLVLATATGAMAAPPNTDNDNTTNSERPLTRQAVIADLVASRQAPATTHPRDGEWYNVPAPLGGMARKLRDEDTHSAKAMPLENQRMASPSK